MSPEVIKEIVKSYIYGMSLADIADAYGLSENDVVSVLSSNKDEIEKEREYRLMLEGGV